MRTATLVLAFLLSDVGVPAGQSVPAPLPSYAEPGISPDGREIAFVSAGDIWTVPAEGGEARLLIAHRAAESHPLYAPDGRRLAFVSMRTGGGDIYILDFSTGALRRLTFDDGYEQLDGWSPDGQWIYFSSASRDIASMNDIFRVRATGGTPMAVTDERYLNEFAGAVSPDGKTLAFSARGNSSSQWWRRGHSHLDMSELWTMRLEDAAASQGAGYTQLTARTGKSSWPMWSAGGRTIFFMSDRDGTENLWSRPSTAGGSDRKLTNFKGGRVLWPSISRDGRRIAFEREFGIWTMDVDQHGGPSGPAGNPAKPVTITRRGAITAPDVERVRSTSQFSELSLSPDGRKIAFVSRGDIFAAASREGGDAARVTFTSGIESSPVWAPDSRRLAYVSAREGEPRIYLYDFATNAERPLTAGGGDRGPAFSPDGKKLSFVRNGRELRVIDVDARDGKDAKLADGLFGDSLNTGGGSWSPDGRWLAIFAVGTKGFTNVQLVPAAGGPARAASFVSNAFANTISWGRDGTYLLFDTRQRTESGQLARVDLVLRTPRFREDQFRDLFTPPARPAPAEPKPAAPAAPAADPRTEKPEAVKPVEPVFEDIRRRVSLLPTGVDVLTHTVSPDGKSVVLIAGAEGQQNLYLYPLDELATDRVARQLTTTSTGKADPQFSPDGRDIFYLDGGRVSIVNIERREARPVSVTAEMTVDFDEEKHEVFRQAWTLMRDNFYDSKFHGVDWSESQKIYAPRIAGAGSADEMRRLINLMIGELNASHLGISSPGGAAAQAGKLGLRFDRIEYEQRGRLRVTEIIPLGPAAVAGEIRPGDYLLAIDGAPLGSGVNLDERLQHAIDRRVMLRVSASAEGTGAREIAVRPINVGSEKNLLYRAWVEANREYVLKKSGGRLGYVHMFSMGAPQLEQLYMDLDAENHAREGVVIDIRNNNGGFVNVYAIDVIARQPYLRMTVRGMPEVPARSALGQRALEAPTALVTNQHSLSDAEDFTEGYRTLKLGPVIGEPTSGWIIYTWNTQLIDGSGFRLPRMKVVGADGKNMELAPRQVDVPVTRPVGETRTGKDSQLDAAIAELLKRIKN